MEQHSWDMADAANAANTAVIIRASEWHLTVKLKNNTAWNTATAVLLRVSDGRLTAKLMKQDSLRYGRYGTYNGVRMTSDSAAGGLEGSPEGNECRWWDYGRVGPPRQKHQSEKQWRKHCVKRMKRRNERKDWNGKDFNAISSEESTASTNISCSSKKCGRADGRERDTLSVREIPGVSYQQEILFHKETMVKQAGEGYRKKGDCDCGSSLKMDLPFTTCMWTHAGR